MNIAAIIPAAGSGSRAGFAENKIFQKIGGVPVLLRSVRAFTRREDIGAVAVCAAEGELARVRELLAGEPKSAVVAGGDTRTASVRAALEYFAALPCPPDYVLVHDAARPFVSQEVIGGCIACTRSHGSGVCALPCTDTLAKGQFGMISSFYERGSAYAVQTPQGFGFTELLRAYRSIGADENFTDDSGVYAKYIAPPFCAVARRRTENSPLRRTLWRSSCARASASIPTNSARIQTISCWAGHASPQRAALSPTATATCSATR